MMDRKDEGTVPTPPKPEKPAEPKHTGGGFGEFAEMYRARWAANHPNMRHKDWSGGPESEAVSPSTSAPDDPTAESKGEPKG